MVRRRENQEWGEERETPLKGQSKEEKGFRGDQLDFPEGPGGERVLSVVPGRPSEV